MKELERKLGHIPSPEEIKTEIDLLKQKAAQIKQAGQEIKQRLELLQQEIEKSRAK